MVDHLLQTFVSPKKAFPRCLAMFKCVVGFLRNEPYVGEVWRGLKAKGSAVVAEILQTTILVFFAAWP